MSSFKLPKVNDIIHEKQLLIKVDSNKNLEQHISFNSSLYNYIKQSKTLISENFEKWDNYKKYTNPYEYIHTYYDKHSCVSKMKPLSRAYYKMVEMINFFNIFKKHVYTNINSFHLAEGPGGFIEAFVDQRKNKNDRYYGTTLLSDDNNTPGWKKSQDFISKNSNIVIENGYTQNGDLYSSKNLEYFDSKYSGMFDIVTGDGGFDFSADFTSQESSAFRLIYSQILFNLYIQKEGGTFILKIFDLFTKSSNDMIYLLNTLYETVHIFKPKTSRYANSEKYVICKGFKRDKFLAIKEKLTKIFIVFEKLDFNKYMISDLLQIRYNYDYVNYIQELNSIIGQQQLNVINNTIVLIKKTNINHNKLENDKRINIIKCIEWCKEHCIPYNDYKKTNMFLH